MSKSCLTKLFRIRNIFGSSSQVFVNLRLSFEIFENLPNFSLSGVQSCDLPVTFEESSEIFGNKSKSLNNRQKVVCIIFVR